jgi:hypothetical protein
MDLAVKAETIEEIFNTLNIQRSSIKLPEYLTDNHVQVARGLLLLDLPSISKSSLDSENLLTHQETVTTEEKQSENCCNCDEKMPFCIAAKHSRGLCYEIG